MDKARHNTDLSLAGCDNTGTVWSDQTGPTTLHISCYLKHVEHRNTLGDTDHQIKVRINRLHNGVRRKRWRNVYDRNVSPRLALGLLYGIKERNPLKVLSTLARCYPCYHLCAVLAARPGVKSAGLSSNALRYNACVLIY